MSLTGLSELAKQLEAYESKYKKVILNVAAIEWERTVQKNFEAGGRPEKWQPRKRVSKKQKGTNILVIRGALKNYRATINESSGEIILTADPRARAYARIHDQGGEINIPARTVRHRQKRYKDGRRRTVFASSKHTKITNETQTKSYTIVIPKRMHTNIPQEDFPRIMNAIIKAINF